MQKATLREVRRKAACKFLTEPMLRIDDDGTWAARLLIIGHGIGDVQELHESSARLQPIRGPLAVYRVQGANGRVIVFGCGRVVTRRIVDEKQVGRPAFDDR